MRAFWFAVALFVPTYMCGQNAAQNSMAELKSLLKAGAITRVEILRIPDDVTTRTSVTPEALRSIASYKVIFCEGFEPTFSALLSETSLKRSSQRSDLRWGILFYDASGREICSMFVDRFGENGYLKEEPVVFGSNLAKRLRQIIRELR
jgi:hypothetical protein